MTLFDVYNANEAFLTDSDAGLIPVIEVDRAHSKPVVFGKKFGSDFDARFCSKLTISLRFQR